MKNSRNILICPLEWGLGHAARMIPVAERFRRMNCNVIIGAGNEHLALFHKEIPGISTIEFPGFRPVYSKHLPQYLYLFFMIPSLITHIISEHRKIKKIIAEHKIDIVISDNRFGLWSKGIKTIYFTHQPRIPFPGVFRIFESAGIALHRAVMKRYSFCFIPDLPGDINLTGRLSHGLRLPENTSYIGILSRFLTSEPVQTKLSAGFRHNTVILSGPEPQRGILRNRLTEVMRKGGISTVILGGKPESASPAQYSDNIIYQDHLPASEMKELLKESEIIIARSGYTTIMELVSLNRSAVLIPTPGQTEQEYLASYLHCRGWFYSIKQKNILSGMDFPLIRSLPSQEIINCSRSLFEEAVRKMSED